jgi:hypothetical protein
MTLKVAYFQPIVLAMDQVPPVEFSKIFSLAEQLHSHPELNDVNNPLVSIRGGQQIQVYPNQLGISIDWLITWIETICQGYMEIVASQSGTDDLKLCKPVITSIWTIRQEQGHYQELHSHPGGNISGNIYITAPDFAVDGNPADGVIAFKLPQTRDVSKFIMNDIWKYKPVPGNVIVFPSHLAHTVYPWKVPGCRTVMSFDAKLVPKDE